MLHLQHSMLFAASSGCGCWQAKLSHATSSFIHSCSSSHGLVDIVTWKILEYRIGKVALAQRSAGYPLQHSFACRGITRVGIISGSIQIQTANVPSRTMCVCRALPNNSIGKLDSDVAGSAPISLAAGDGACAASMHLEAPHASIISRNPATAMETRIIYASCRDI